MSKQRKVSTLDGYATLKAAARAVKAHEKAESPASTNALPAPAAPATDQQKIGTGVGRTVMPARHVIECYECGYKFQLHGRASKTNCSKCRAVLDLSDHTIDSDWSESLRTTGTIRLTSRAILKAGDLIANDAVLDGILEGGRIRAMRRLELGPSAIFSEKSIAASDLKIGAGASITFKQEVKYRDVEVFGTLNARLHASGIVTVRLGGLLTGEVHATHLVVDEGGGLKATLHIAPGGAKAEA